MQVNKKKFEHGKELVSLSCLNEEIIKVNVSYCKITGKFKQTSFQPVLPNRPP
jgi:hypothetical protein